MKHYICTGTCGGTSTEPKACGTENCIHQGQMMEPCDCSDNKHSGRQTHDKEGKSNAIPEGGEYTT